MLHGNRTREGVPRVVLAQNPVFDALSTLPSGNGKTAAAARRAKAVKLRGQGLSWREVANACGYKSASAACTAVGQALKATTAEVAKPLRGVENAKLDRLEKMLWPLIESGGEDGPNGPAIDRLLRVLERRAKLFGLDMPTQPPDGDGASPRQAIVFVLNGGQVPGRTSDGGAVIDVPSA